MCNAGDYRILSSFLQSLPSHFTLSHVTMVTYTGKRASPVQVSRTSLSGYYRIHSMANWAIDHSCTCLYIQYIILSRSLALSMSECICL